MCVLFSKMIISKSFLTFLFLFQKITLIQCHLFGESSRVEKEHDIAKDQAAEFQQIVEDTEWVFIQIFTIYYFFLSFFLSFFSDVSNNGSTVFIEQNCIDKILSGKNLIFKFVWIVLCDYYFLKYKSFCNKCDTFYVLNETEVFLKHLKYPKYKWFVNLKSTRLIIVL